MTIKIQLNDYKSLQKFFEEFGEDAKIEIKNTLIEQFGNQYIKCLMKEQIFESKMINDLKEEYEEKVTDYLQRNIADFSIYGSSYRNFNLKPEFKVELMKAADKIFDDKIYEKLSNNIEETINKKIERIETRIEDIIERSLNSKIESLITQKIELKKTQLEKLQKEISDLNALQRDLDN